jgi:hypothetical protein
MSGRARAGIHGRPAVCSRCRPANSSDVSRYPAAHMGVKTIAELTFRRRLAARDPRTPQWFAPERSRWSAGRMVTISGAVCAGRCRTGLPTSSRNQAISVSVSRSGSSGRVSPRACPTLTAEACGSRGAGPRDCGAEHGLASARGRWHERKPNPSCSGLSQPSLALLLASRDGQGSQGRSQ